MARRKSLAVRDFDITIREVNVIDILDMIEDPDLPLSDRLNFLMERCVEGITFKDFLNIAPSEIEAIFDAFREVNASFFKVARLLGMEQRILLKAAEIMNGFMQSYFSSSKPATDQESSDTPGAGSCGQSSTTEESAADAGGN